MEIPGYKGNLAWLGARTIFLTRHGSHAYGTATQGSDVDIRGVALPPRAYFMGFAQRFEQAEITDPDVVIYELRKFVSLAADCNPNVVEVLFTDPSDHLGTTPLGERLLAARGGFLSQRARHTFSGFAMAQLKRLQQHHRWITAPPAGPPPRALLGLPDEEATTRDAQASGRGREWEQYQQWKKTRNPKRAVLEQSFGYDTKFGVHVVRLLRMAREILETGEVLVKRPDADELRAIRAGAWTFERLVGWAHEADAALDEIAKRSALPHGPDRAALDALCVRLVEAGLAAGDGSLSAAR